MTTHRDNRFANLNGHTAGTVVWEHPSHDGNLLVSIKRGDGQHVNATLPYRDEGYMGQRVHCIDWRWQPAQRAAA